MNTIEREQLARLRGTEADVRVVRALGPGRFAAAHIPGTETFAAWRRRERRPGGVPVMTALPIRRKAVLLTVGLAVPAFLLGPHAPLGAFVWPEPVGLATDPTGMQTGLFAILLAVTAVAFGAGTSFAIWGWSAVRDVFGPARRKLAVATHLSIVWVLWNWWLHDGLHMVVGPQPGGLLAIEYGFHVTLMLAGGVLAYAVFTLPGAVASIADRGEDREPVHQHH